MKPSYDVNVLSYAKIHELPGSWEAADYQSVLELADFDDWDEIATTELKDYTILALQEMEVSEAFEIVLSYRLTSLTKGQIHNLAHDMLSDKMWEEYQDISLHKEIYNCSVLMKWVFPTLFPETDAVKFELEIKPKNAAARDVTGCIDKSFLIRIMANGLDDHAIINRLFDAQLNGAPFPEADSIIWDFEYRMMNDAVHAIVYSSNYWLKTLQVSSQFESDAISDLIQDHA